MHTVDAIIADSPSDLLRQLRAVDVDVPSRVERTTEQVQRNSICRFLSTFADSELLRYPLKLDPDDRPDFVLSSGGAPVGIEVTEAVSMDLARADALQEHRGYDVVRFFQRFRPGKPARPLAEIEQIAQGLVLGEGWAGDSVETDWAEVMTYFSIAKADKFSRPGFRIFPSNWLLIYDNWELPMLNEAKAAGFFHAQLAALNPPLAFERIFVECNKTIWQFTPSGPSRRNIIDLWADS
jgi:hypothetical protein